MMFVLSAANFVTSDIVQWHLTVSDEMFLVSNDLKLHQTQMSVLSVRQEFYRRE